MYVSKSPTLEGVRRCCARRGSEAKQEGWKPTGNLMQDAAHLSNAPYLSCCIPRKSVALPAEDVKDLLR
jgi:hypothetical protein